MSSGKDRDRMQQLAVLRGLDGSVARHPALGVFREDKAEPSLNRESLLKNAPATENGYFIVPGRTHP